MVGTSQEQADADWIKTYRCVRENLSVGFLDDRGVRRKGAIVCETMAWIDLCMEVNWRDRAINHKGRVVLLERGQMLAGRAWLADRWGWTEKKVRYFIEKLVRDGMILLAQPKYGTTKANAEMGPATRQVKGNSANTLTVCNYNIYQASVEIAELLDGQHWGQRGASEGPHLKKEGKERRSTNVDMSSGVADDPAPSQPELVLAEEPAKLTASVAAREAFALYNETAKRCGLPVARTLDKARARALALRVKEAGGLDGFRTAMANIEKSAFLQGKNDRGWAADLKFVCQPTSFAKLLEGGYGNGAHAQTGRVGYGQKPREVVRVGDMEYLV